MKRPRCLLFAQDGHARYRFLDTVQSAAIFCNRDPRAVDLAGPGLVTQLRDKFVDLREAGGADRMPLRFQSSRRIDRYATSDSGFAAFADGAAVAEGAQAEIFYLDDLAHGGSIVHFGNRDIARPDACLFVSASGGA